MMKDWLYDLRTAVAFLTRLPMPHPHGAAPANFIRAVRLFPLVGAAIGGSIGVLCVALRAAGMPALAAAALAIGAGAFLTGALHEDGLADVADGFGGGKDRSAKLEIMRDSRLGTYGTLILLVAFSAKVSAIAAVRDDVVVRALIAAHVLSRAVLPFMSLTVGYARKDGLAVTAGRPELSTAATAGGIALIITFLALRWPVALVAMLIAAACALGMAWLARRQIGGLTGDVLGATQQVGETAILLLLATLTR
jgi:adenosylcobinamide-GDP ribazoletransferase